MVKQLNFEEKCLIKKLSDEGHSINHIARVINRAKSTVSYEIQRSKLEMDKDKKEKKPNYTRLSLQERQLIYRFINEGKKTREIASLLGRGKNCITLEIRRNGGALEYDPEKAQIESNKRHDEQRNSLKTQMNEYARTEGYFNPYASLKNKIELLEMQIDILVEAIKEIKEKQNG